MRHREFRLLYGSFPIAQAVDESQSVSSRKPAIRTPVVIPRPEHNISRANISENALKVLYRLKDAGYGAYLVGGCVRDLLLGREPKDFDVTTDARPEEIRALFRNCRLIGRRFRLAHIHFGRDIIEVATFRALHADEDDDPDRLIEDGRIVRDNVYGTIEEDAWRRDFTVNALYYRIDDFSVIDYVGGMEDLRGGVLRLIGEPPVRYREDPVRMLRAVRFAVKLGFRMHPDTEASIRDLGPLLADISPARLYDEVLKLFLSGSGEATFDALRHFGLFRFLFPGTDTALDALRDGPEAGLVRHGLISTDRRVAEEKPVTPAFLYAALLWPPLRQRMEALMAGGMAEAPALQQASREVFEAQSRQAILPRRFSAQMREIWMLQLRLPRRGGGRAARLVEHPRFRAAYDFLLLRAAAGEPLTALGEWWTTYQTLDEESRARLVQALGEEGRSPRRRRRRPRTPKASEEEA